MSPSEIREIINDAVEELEGSKISDGFKSLMDYIDCDLLVSWFVDEVCQGEIGDVISNHAHEKEILNWYELHC